MLGKKNASAAPKVLEVDANFQGNLVFKDEVNLHINGRFEGRLETKGDLLIGEHASVKATIVGERITVAGAVNGDVAALSELKLKSTAKVIGDIRTPSLELERGAVLQGLTRMLPESVRSAEQRPVFFTVDEVSRYLSVESALISEWVSNGKFPGRLEGDNWIFEKQKVDEWIANGRII